MDGKKFDKNTLKTLVIAASLLLNCILGGASYTYYHHLAEQMNETASLQSQEAIWKARSPTCRRRWTNPSRPLTV